jgi:hypothetical protein
MHLADVVLADYIQGTVVTASTCLFSICHLSLVAFFGYQHSGDRDNFASDVVQIGQVQLQRAPCLMIFWWSNSVNTRPRLCDDAGPAAKKTAQRCC